MDVPYVYLRNISSISVSCTLFLSMNLYVCHLYVIHALLAHLHSLFSCTITVPLSHYYCHALLNMSPYCYLIHGTKYFRGETEYFIFSAEIFSPGAPNISMFLRGQTTEFHMNAILPIASYTNGVGFSDPVCLSGKSHTLRR